MVKKIDHFKSKLLFGNQLNVDIDTIINKEYQNCKKIIITDETVYDLWIEDLITSTSSLQQAEIIQLPAGEGTKSIEICYQIWESLAEYKINRGDLIINFGGGVITDVGGFIASTFKRGLHFINIPTTLLSQVDASVGGKTGINLGEKKNLIGTFSDADYVFIDNKYLLTLDEFQLKSGFAEMLKHGLIKDEKHWKNLIELEQVNAEAVAPFVYDSVLIKQQIVKGDPFEEGLRKSLNFGHTFGHAYESFLLKQGEDIQHGYAVALGMIIESQLSFELKLIDQPTLNTIKEYLQSIYKFTFFSTDDVDELLDLMKHDKKNSNESYNFTLLNGIGDCKIDCFINEDLLRLAIEKCIEI